MGMAKEVRFKFTWAERRVFKKQDPLTVSQWAERYRIVTMGANKGPWRNYISPHLGKVMDMWGASHVREVVICKSPQTGGTEVELNCIGYAIDRDPSTMMLVMPSESLASRTNVDRIIPMIEQSPKLRELISPNPDDMARMRIKLRNGALFYIAWANSPTALASFPIKYLFFDEVDKYPAQAGKETDPISLGEKRTITFSHTRKIMKVSTPTREEGHIWQAWQKVDVQYRYYAKCPFCGQEQLMKIDNLKWEEASVQEILRKELAWYECESCKAKWGEVERKRAIRGGGWRPNKEVSRARSVGFHMPAWISSDVALAEIAAAYLMAQQDRVKMIDFYNAYLAEPYQEIVIDRQEDMILALRDERPRGLVPKEADILLASVDTQMRGFYYEIRAWKGGYEMESWLVREGYVETFDALVKVLLDDTYQNADGNQYKVEIAFIDSGAGVGEYGVSRTAEVYDFCRRFRKIIPIKGQQRMSSAYKVTTLDVYPGTNKVIPGGLKLYHINVTYYKDYLASKLSVPAHDAGAWHLHKEVDYSYARQMCAEYKDDNGFWQKLKNRENHWWDCAVYNLALADIVGVKYLQNKKKEVVEAKDEREQKTRRAEKIKRW